MALGKDRAGHLKTACEKLGHCLRQPAEREFSPYRASRTEG
jgi:hypothetical protein